MAQDRLMNAAGFLIWIGCAVPTLLTMRSGALQGWTAAAWWIAFIAFGASWLWFQLAAELESASRRLLLALETLAAFVMVGASVGGTYYLSGSMVIFIAAQLPHALPSAAAWLWVAGQSVILTAIFWQFDRGLVAWSMGAAYAGFSAVTMHRVMLMRSERQARIDLAQANIELRAARELLAENSRVAERLRISRDLHDALGHHLTALSIQLDVAARRSTDSAAEHVREAYAISRLLLGDVRDAVSQLRQGARMNLAEAVRSVATDIGELRVHLDMPAELYIDDPAMAEAMLRSVQEIVTNAARHARAHHLWIRIEANQNELSLRARDDGRGAAELKMGNGLTGMSERFKQQRGELQITTAAGKGFELHARLPQLEVAS